MSDKSDDKRFRKACIIGIFVIFVLSVLWHFLFELLPGTLTAVLSPVNESLWEHTKLFFFPALIWYAVLFAIAGKEYANFIFAHATMLIAMPATALLLHGIYRLFMPECVVLDIIITLLAIALWSLAAYKLTVSTIKLHGKGFYFAALLIVFGIAAFHAVFTFCPPNHPLFQDPTAANRLVLWPDTTC